jgi:hypothetical protein
MKRFLSVLTALGAGLLCSCVGLSSDIVLNADGAGTIRLEYRVSRYFEAIGALDGNAGWPAFPVGREDFERSLGRLKGLRLDSFSSSADERDQVTKAVISFSRLEDILPLLDSGGLGASLRREGDKQALSLRLGSGGAAAEDNDPQLLALMEQVSLDYGIAFSLSAPGGVELRVRGDQEGLSVEGPGKKAGFSVALSRFFRPGGDLDLEFVF